MFNITNVKGIYIFNVSPSHNTSMRFSTGSAWQKIEEICITSHNIDLKIIPCVTYPILNHQVKHDLINLHFYAERRWHGCMELGPSPDIKFSSVDPRRAIKLLQWLSWFRSLRFIVEGYCCGQEGSPVAVCVAADLKKPLTEDIMFHLSFEFEPQKSQREWSV